MIVCKICGKEVKDIKALSAHLNYHNIKLINYMVKYEKFKIPKCIICKKEAKYYAGLKFRKTCGSSICRNEIRHRCKHSDATKKLQSKRRFEYMRNNPDYHVLRKTIEPSWPEKIFIKGLKDYGFYNKFSIEREKCFHPYFADFAFLNVKVVVEVDGEQHLKLYRKQKDKEKDKLITSKGWRVFRVTAKQVKNNIKLVLDDLLVFIGNNYEKAYTSKIVTEKEKKDIKLKKKRLLNNINREIQEIKRRHNFLIEYNNINKSHGWVMELGRKLNVSHTQIRRYIKKYIPT